jgi:hypothetical protein
MADDRLTLLASSRVDLPVLSALMQDAIIRVGDVAWDRRGRRLVLLASRYRWEAAEISRVRTALRIETARKVRRLHWPSDLDATLALLSITAHGDCITLTFSEKVSLCAEVECLDAVLEDLSAPWMVRHRPNHAT